MCFYLFQIFPPVHFCQPVGRKAVGVGASAATLTLKVWFLFLEDWTIQKPIDLSEQRLRGAAGPVYRTEISPL